MNSLNILLSKELVINTYLFVSNLNFFNIVLFIFILYLLKILHSNFFLLVNIFNTTYKFNNKKKIVGIIINKNTNKPVKHALIKLYRFSTKNKEINKKLIEVTISNKDGLYSLKNNKFNSNLFIEANLFGFNSYYKEILNNASLGDFNELAFNIELSNKSKTFIIVRLINSFITFLLNVALFLTLSLSIIWGTFKILTTNLDILPLLYLSILVAILLNFIFSKYRFNIKRIKIVDHNLMIPVKNCIAKIYNKDFELLEILVTNKKGYITIDKFKPDYLISLSKNNLLLKENSFKRIGLNSLVKYIQVD